MDDPKREHKPATAAAPGAEAPLDPRLQAHIGHQLRALYDDVLSQPVPDRFMDLLSRLDGPAPALKVIVPKEIVLEGIVAKDRS